jgi:asparagine N-glycosylation enzyme membrane subunit Stt3
VSAASRPAPWSPRAWRLSLLALLLLVAGTAVLRVRAALSDPEFDAASPVGLLKSDPGLLYYLVERVVESGGAAPADFAADPRIEHPGTVDVWARFPPAQLFLVAWTHLVFGGAQPLHLTCLWVSAVCASLALAGVWLFALELSRRPGLALAAALLAAATPAFHRTIGFVLVDEDFCWPLLILHLGLAARAARVRTPLSVALAALALAGALATWHAAGLFASLEALVALGWLLATGRNPLAVRGGWLAPLILVAACLGVPFLRHVDAALSFPVAVAVALWLASRPAARRAPRTVALAATAALVGAGALLARSGGGQGELGHVLALLLSKLEHVGLKPGDPRGLAPEVRLMWQGPFETTDLATALAQLSIAGALGVAAAAFALRRREQPGAVALCALFALSLGAAWLAVRALVLPALLAAALCAWAAAQLRRPLGALALLAACAAQIALCAAWLAAYENPWYHAPVQRQAELRWLVAAVERHVPAGEAVAADFMTSTAILAHARRPICFQPKWESAEARRRAVELLDAFHHRSPAEFRRLIVERYRARWLVVDRFTLGYLARWSAGLAPGQAPQAGSAAAALLSGDDAELRAIEGYELVARSPASIRQSNGQPADFYRLYRLAP